jgi:ArpU family phage transcriptional regulator
VGVMGALKLDHRREVEQILKKYPIYKRTMNVLPACVLGYEERVQGGLQEFISSTEKFASIRTERKALVEAVEFAISFLTPRERKLIHETYFRLEDKPKINIVWQRLNLTKSSYYRQKYIALEKITDLLLFM